jgi:hypothetical protein
MRRRLETVPGEVELAHLGNNSGGHLGGLERLSRFSRLDAQSAERKESWESLPYGLRT